MTLHKVYVKPLVSAHVRSIASASTHGGNWLDVLLLLVPVFGVSSDRRLRVYWLLWAFYFGRGNQIFWRRK